VSPIPAADLEMLRKYDTPTICNVIELFDVQARTAGYMDSRIQACYPKLPPMVGFAATATFRSAAPPRTGDVYAGLGQQIESFARLPGPPIVVFQDLDDPTVAATFGEIMCTTYQTFGAVGLVTSGAGRDLDQVEALGFPCFTAGTIPAHGYCQIVQLDIPVSVGGVMVYPGDLLHGDRNGVTTIPNKLAAAVAAGCEEFMAAESIVLDALRSGRRDAKEFADARRQCQDRIESLGVRLRRTIG